MSWFEPAVLSRGRDGGHGRRVRARLLMFVALVFLLAAVSPAVSSRSGHTGAKAVVVGENRDRLAGSSAAAAAFLRPREPTEVRTPALVGLTVEEAFDALRSSGFSGQPALVRSRYIANNSTPAGVVIAQDIPPETVVAAGTAVPIEVSAGGPAVESQELPASTQLFALALPGFDPEEPILVVDTAAGIAFKTDRWLFGHCPAVDAAYRTFADPEYGTSCEVASSALPRTG